MNAGELWDTAMNPETRTLIKVTLADAKGAMAKASDMFDAYEVIIIPSIN